MGRNLWDEKRVLLAKVYVFVNKGTIAYTHIDTEKNKKIGKAGFH
jgi:hypothetical protein